MIDKEQGAPPRAFLLHREHEKNKAFNVVDAVHHCNVGIPDSYRTKLMCFSSVVRTRYSRSSTSKSMYHGIQRASILVHKRRPTVQKCLPARISLLPRGEQRLQWYRVDLAVILAPHLQSHNHQQGRRLELKWTLLCP